MMDTSFICEVALLLAPVTKSVFFALMVVSGFVFFGSERINAALMIVVAILIAVCFGIGAWASDKAVTCGFVQTETIE